MCGIVGYIGIPGLTKEKAFEHLLIVDTIRGAHSTGVALILSDKQWRVIKNTTTPYPFLQHDIYKEATKQYWPIMIGHNRYATKGKITVDNAHPHVQGKIIGVHNGTLNSLSELPDNEKFESDSANFFHSIDVLGIEETWKITYGGCAAVWWDNNNSTLNFIRNAQRPLCYSFLEDGKGVFFASEGWMITGVADRNRIKLDKEPLSLKTNRLFSVSYTINKGLEIVESKELEPSKTKGITYYCGGSAYQNTWEKKRESFFNTREENNRKETKSTSESVYLSKSQIKKLRKIERKEARRRDYELIKKGIDPTEYKLDFDGAKIYKEEFKTRFKDCYFCQEPLEWEDRCDIEWIDRHDAACPTCSAFARDENIDLTSAK